MNRLIVAVVCLSLAACGGSSTPSTPAPVPTPVPTPVPSFSGTYTGTMLYNVQGQAEVRLPARVGITQNGNSLDLSNLTLTAPAPTGTLTYGLGNATLNGNTFTGTHAYNSAGCGRIDVQTSGRFAGNLVNLTVILMGGCPRSEMRGELSR